MHRVTWSVIVASIVLLSLLAAGLAVLPHGDADGVTSAFAQPPGSPTPGATATSWPQPTRPPSPTPTDGPSPTPEPTPGTASNVEATVFGDSVLWRTVPAAIVRLEVRDGTGRMTAQGYGTADSAGKLTIRVMGIGGPGYGGAGYVRPGDDVRLIPTGAARVAVKVPALFVGANVDANHVVGQGPADTALDLEVIYGPGAGDVVRQPVTTDGSGAFDVALAAPALLAPGVSGRVTMTTVDNNRFHATFNVLEAEVVLGGRQATGRATLGTNVRVSLAGAGGNAKGSDRGDVMGQPDWQVPSGRNMSLFGPIVAGDTISITQVSRVPGCDTTLRAIVPNLTVTVDLRSNRVEGVAPPDTAIEIVLTSPYGETATRQTTSDAAGNYGVSVADAPGFGRGWRATARFTLIPGLRVAAFEVIEQVRVGIWANIVTGVAAPGVPVTITLRGADGKVKATDNPTTANNGQFSTMFYNGLSQARIAIGDTVEVEFVKGDPVIVRVDPVTAVTDPLADVVSGTAPPGTSVRVSYTTGSTASPGPQIVVVADSDGTGAYRADFTGQLDIAPPMNGDVSVRLPSGHELFTAWAAVQLTMEIRTPYLVGNGPSGREISAELVDPNGTVVATGKLVGSWGGSPSPPQWTQQFVDTLGAAVNVRSGDTVRAVVGDDHLTVKVPDLYGVAFVGDDVINGRTAPNRGVTIVIQRVFTGDTASAGVTSNARGDFTQDFTGTFDIQHNDAILFTTHEGVHVINSRIAAPGLRVDLDLGVVTGSWRPDTDVTYELRDASGVRSSGTARCGDDALFTIHLTDTSGQPVTPVQGDVLNVRPVDGDLDTPLVLTVPELTIAYDVDTDAMGGRAAPGGGLIFQVSDPIGRGITGPTNRRAVPLIAPDATYVVTYTPTLDLQPGLQMQALYRLPSGHLVQRTRYAPILNVQYGGANVCGFTEPRDFVEATLSDASGVPLGDGAAQAGHDSRYQLELTDPAGALVATGVTQTVRATLAGKPVAVTLPTVSVQVDWDRGRVQGRAPAGMLFQILRPVRGCLDTGTHTVQGRGLVSPQGQFVAGFGANLPPGEGFELGFFTANGHRFYRYVFKSLAQIWVYTDLVTGRATPLTPVTVVLTDAAGTEKGRATTVSTTDGTYVVRFRDGAGDPVKSEPGDKVRLDASGENPEVTVEDLSFDWSLDDPLVGSAPAGRKVTVTVSLADATSVVITLTADAQGAFRFGAEDVPPRSAWGLQDIRGVTAAIDTPNGHQIIAGTDQPKEPAPPARAARIFLPRGLKHR